MADISWLAFIVASLVLTVTPAQDMIAKRTVMDKVQRHIRKPAAAEPER
jgi:heme exporter protein D